MRDIPEDWEVVSQKTNDFWFGMLGLFTDAGWSNVTWTVRQKSSGLIKRVTANDETAAAERIARGQFDAD